MKNFKIKVNRRNAHLDENKRKAMVYSEKLSNYYDFIDEMIEKLESKRKNIDPRKGKLLLDKHQETVAEIQNNEKIYDDVRKEANKLNDSSKLPSGKMPTPYIFTRRRLQERFSHITVAKDHLNCILDKKLLTEELQNIKQNWINLKKVSSLYGNELQDCLVSSGRLIEALETLEDWLIRVEPDLAEVKVNFRSTSGFNNTF